MPTQGIGTFGINSKFASGNLVFYEKTVGRTATGDVFTVGTAAVKVGGTSQDVDFQFYATGSVSAIIDAGAATLTLIGVTSSTDKPLTISDATESTSTTTGALIVSGGIGFAKDMYVGDDVFLTSAAKLDWNAGDVTLTHAANLLTLGGGAFNVGADGGGFDVKVFGATASAYCEWDASADRFNVVTVSGRAISGEEHAVDIVNGGTVSSGDSMVGLNVKTTASGSAASWVSGLFVNTTQASKVVNGYLCAAEFELTSTAAGASDNSVIVLNSVRNHTGSPPAADPYILLREYGTTYADSLFRVFGDTGQGDQSTLSTTRVVTSVQAAYEANCDCAFRVVVGSTPIWILASTTTPTS